MRRNEKERQARRAEYQLGESLFLLTKRCSESVKQLYPDMRDCHAACDSLVRELRHEGFTDVMRLPCDAIIRDVSGTINVRHATTEGEHPAHSVVLIKGYILDPTFGQFRKPSLEVPDFMILGPSAAAVMLQNQPLSVTFATKDTFQFAYIPRAAQAEHEQ